MNLFVRLRFQYDLRFYHHKLYGLSVSDFKTLIDSLIDAIIALVTVGSSTTQTLDAATIAALQQIKTDFGSVFE